MNGHRLRPTRQAAPATSERPGARPGGVVPMAKKPKRYVGRVYLGHGRRQWVGRVRD